MSDAQLMQYLHDELNDAERAHIDAQVAGSPAVADRLRVLRRRSTRLSSLLGAMDPAPAEVQESAREIRPLVDRSVITHVHWWRRTPPALRAAAAIALLLGGVLLVEPVRAWVSDRLAAIAEAVGLIDAGPASVAPAVAPAGGADMRLSFTWSAAVFDIATGNAAGTLTIATGRDDEASVAITSAAGTSIMVVPTGIRIEGAGSPAAVYSITLPNPVATVRVIRGATTVEYAVPADGSTLRVPLR